MYIFRNVAEKTDQKGAWQKGRANEAVVVKEERSEENLAADSISIIDKLNAFELGLGLRLGLVLGLGLWLGFG